MGRDADLTGEVVEQPEVRGRQRVGGAARRDEQAPDRRDRKVSGRSMTSAGRVPRSAASRAVGPDPSSSPTYGRRSASATVSTTTRGIDSGIDAQLQPLAEPADRPDRLVAVAVDQRVAARWRTSRIGRAARAAMPDASSDVANGLAVPRTAPMSQPRRRRRDHRDRQPAVDDRATDDDVEVERPVTEDRDRDQDGNGRPVSAAIVHGRSGGWPSASGITQMTRSATMMNPITTPNARSSRRSAGSPASSGRRGSAGWR